MPSPRIRVIRVSNLPFGSVPSWISGISFGVGKIVIDRGGIWKALVSNTNSRPVSGNADWELVGGTPYVKVRLNNAEMLAALADTDAVPFEVIPACLPTQLIVPQFALFATTIYQLNYTGSHGSCTIAASDDKGQKYSPIYTVNIDDVLGLDNDDTSSSVSSAPGYYSGFVQGDTLVANLVPLGQPMVFCLFGGSSGITAVTSSDDRNFLDITVYYDIWDLSEWNVYPDPLVIETVEGGIKFLNTAVSSIQFPNLTTIPDGLNFQLQFNSNLTEVLVPLLATLGVSVAVTITDQTLLTSLSFPSLSNLDDNINISVMNCALDVTSVNNLLIKINEATLTGSPGTVDLTGSLMAAPTGAGAAAKADLIGAGWTVNTE